MRGPEDGAFVRFGLILPHFGSDPDPDAILSAARRAELLGFHSVWVRDRVAASAPHGLLLEAGGTTFLEPLTTLAAVGAVTQRLILGTAVLMLPTHHPVKLLQAFGTLHRLVGSRIVMGVGLGVGESSFRGVGARSEDRREIFEEMMTVIGRGLGGDEFEFSGRHFEVGRIRIAPAPPADLPIWYGGTSRAAVRRAVRYGSGWVAGRLPIDTFRERIGFARTVAQEAEKELEVGTIPLTVIDEDGPSARSAVSDEVVEILARSAEGSSDWIRPPSGRFETIEDLAGLLIAGDPTACREEVRRLVDIGVDHVVFDLRLMFDRFEEGVELLGSQVLPHVGT